MAVIYRHIRLDTNNVFYIGIGKNENRAYHKHSRNRYWYNIINKTEYEVQILKRDLSWVDACELEKLLISYYGRKDLGLGTLVNMTDGGDGIIGQIPHNKGKKGFRHSKETIEKLSGSNNQFYGKKHSDETKLKLSIKASDRRHSDETKLKMSLIRKGKSINNKIILDLYTGIFYNSLKEASYIFDIKYVNLSNMLNGRVKNKTNLVYV
jgi:hypothetical protein